MNTNFYKNLGLSIKKRRKELKITQQQLANLVNVELNHIGKVEVGYSKPSLDLVINIATALKVAVSDLTNFKKLKK